MKECRHDLVDCVLSCNNINVITAYKYLHNWQNSIRSKKKLQRINYTN